LAVAILVSQLPSYASAADLDWQVENPFRFFKRSTSFEMHERAFLAAKGGESLPTNIVWRTERKLNDPDCKDASTPANCAASARARYETSRAGWAAQTLDVTCYDRAARPRRYITTCERQYSWGIAKEDYVLPDAHTVILKLSPEKLADAGAGNCVWSWQPRRGGAGETKTTQPCKADFVIKRVPFSLNRVRSGAAVKVTLPDGTELSDPNVVVDDVLIVAMGDSFASGESNPDRPVKFSPTREMVYDPTLANDQFAQDQSSKPSGYGLAAADDGFNPKALPKRLMDDEQKGLIYKPNSPEFLKAFDLASAQWLSTDCHRSQYGYPFRTAIELALENRHRAISFISVACSGAEVVEGLFAELGSREGFSQPGGAKVPPQLDQLADLICRPGTRNVSASYALPVYKSGSTSVSTQSFTKRWCAPEARKRPIDLVLMSIGGNDVGFGALAMYAMTENASDLAPITAFVGSEIRYSPAVARVYLNVLDERMAALKAALKDGLGVEPGRVLQNAYEPIQYDESGQVCGANPTIGLDVHKGLAFNRARMQEVSNVGNAMQQRMACIADAKRPGCPANLATGAGTGFRFVEDHTAEFAKRGICARDPQRAVQDQIQMRMPRRMTATDEFGPYSPAAALPYMHRWRLIHNPNDAFLMGNTHREGLTPFDVLQPAYAALYSGAFHPTAEGHAIVADHVVRHARPLLDKRDIAEAAR
jgi:hypothetical protein